MNKADIIKLLKETFCRHVYKEVDSEFLEKEIELIAGIIIFGIPIVLMIWLIVKILRNIHKSI